MKSETSSGDGKVEKPVALPLCHTSQYCYLLNRKSITSRKRGGENQNKWRTPSGNNVQISFQ